MEAIPAHVNDTADVKNCMNGRIYDPDTAHFLTPDPVAFPASLSSVLAVAAIGKLSTFPADSYHATLPIGTATRDGYFTPRTGAVGPEINRQSNSG